MKGVVLDGYTLNPGDLSWEGFAPLCDLSVYDRTAEAEIIPRIGDAQVVILNKTPVTRAVLDACPGIRYIGVLATGYNVVDIQAARERGIPVCNIPTYGTAAVAQYVFALLLELCHHVGHHSQAVREGRWERSPDWCFWDYPLVELAGQTMGVVGFGRIGQATGRLAQAFGMEVLAYDEYPRPELEAEGFRYVGLDELLARADVVSLHCPLFPATRGLINRERIAGMKDGAMLINTSRGPLVVEQDLADALNAGKLAGAGLDVACVEPLPADSPLHTARNCLVTPHIAWAPRASRQRLMDLAVDNLRAFLAGTPQNVVNG